MIFIVDLNHDLILTNENRFLTIIFQILNLMQQFYQLLASQSK